MLKPLQVIFQYKLFENPSSDKYSWLNVLDAQVILLNDFWWSPELPAFKQSMVANHVATFLLEVG